MDKVISAADGRPRGSGRPRPFRAGRTLLTLACALAWQAPVRAQTLDNDYWISAMAFFPKVDTDVRVAAENQQIPSTDIDFENDLKLDNDEILPSITAGARFGKVIVGADFYKLKRTGATALERDIVFDNVTYPVNAEVESGFDSDIYRLTVGYAFVQNDNLELGAALGAHVTRFDLSIMGEGSVGGESASSELRRRKVLAPLPTLGVFATWKIAHKVEFNGRVDYLSLNIDDYDGRLVNVQAGLNYLATKNIAVGVVYRYVDYRLGVDKDRWNGRVRYKLYGPALVLQASF